MPSIQSSGLVIAAGTYDGVLAGWELKKKKGLELTFATAVHAGSIRSLSIATSPNSDEPGSLLSCGYDEALRTHDWHKRLTSSGEIRTPSDFGTPVCSSFAPPAEHSTHCVLGFSNGKISIYKKRDWSVQHVLAGHEGGVGCLAVHPTGKLALSGGVIDGKLKLWDLTKGRLAFVNKINPSSTLGGKSRYDPISSLVWSKTGSFYAMAYGSHITVREVATGKDLLDVDLPSRVHQVTLMTGPEGIFVAAACNDGSLPVLAVDDSDDENRRAIMAIEPVDAHLAREERFKCIFCVRGYYVVTANSAGVVSLMDLSGAVKMMYEDVEEKSDDSEAEGSADDSENEEDMDLAVEIIESIQLGTGARITCLTAWCKDETIEDEDSAEEMEELEEIPKEAAQDPEPPAEDKGFKRKQDDLDVTMDAAAVRKARSLVQKAKNMKKRKEKKNKKAKVSN
jgi:WD40 repeat protein